MKQNQGLIEERNWDRIKIRMDYGYFGNFSSSMITCYADGMLVFKTENEFPFIDRERVEDRQHNISKKSLAKLDEVAQKLSALENLELVGDMCDGPSFECLIYLSNGTIRGFHYCSEMLTEPMQEMEDQLRKILREDFFLRKHRRED
jgi:hypothetical protein